MGYQQTEDVLTRLGRLEAAVALLASLKAHDAQLSQAAMAALQQFADSVAREHGHQPMSHIVETAYRQQPN